MTEIVPAGAAQPAAPLPTPVAALVRKSKSPATLRAYSGALARLDAWLDGQALDDAALAGYVEHLQASGRAPPTAAMARAAAVWRAKFQNRLKPAGAITEAALEGFRREHGERGRGQARAITADQMTEIIATAKGEGRMMDAAIAGVLFHAALRRSEAAALEWRDLEAANDIPGAIRVRVRRSKTNQAGGETDIRLVKNSGAAALDAIRPAIADPNGKVFGGINRQSIGRRFAAAAKAAGLDGVTAHSGRIGHASELTARGASTTEVMLSGGWKTARMVAHYAAGARAERGAVAKYL